MRILVYILSFLAFMILANGIMFKVQRWPGADVAITNGYILSAIAGLFMMIYKIKENKKETSRESTAQQSSNNNILDA